MLNSVTVPFPVHFDVFILAQGLRWSKSVEAGPSFRPVTGFLVPIILPPDRAVAEISMMELWAQA